MAENVWRTVGKLWTSSGELMGYLCSFPKIRRPAGVSDCEVLFLFLLLFCTCFCHRVKNRTCSRAHFRKLKWGGVGLIATVSMATLQDLHLHFMLCYMIFTCTSCYAIWSSLALHATLYDLHLHFMLRYMIFTCTSCYAIWSSLALHATLHDLHLHFMLRYMIFTCTSWVPCETFLCKP